MQTLEEIELLLQPLPIKDSTKKTYLQTYKRMVKSKIFKNAIPAASEKTIIENIEKLTDKTTSRINLLILCTILQKIYNKDVNELVKYRKKLYDNLTTDISEKNIFLQKALPSFDEIENYINDLYTKKLYIQYVINYLIFTYSTRNLDIDVKVICNKKDLNNNEKFILIRSTDCVFYRNKYKTVSSYGAKKHIIRSRKFLKAMKSIDRPNNQYLLLNNKDEHIDENAIGMYVQHYTMEDIGEGNMFKIKINHYKGDLNKLKQLSQDRGTDINTIITYYNIQS